MQLVIVISSQGFDILTHSLKEFGMVSKESDKDAEYHSPVEVKGWPLLQAMLLVEYIHLCWKMNNYSVLIRYCTCIIVVLLCFYNV